MTRFQKLWYFAVWLSREMPDVEVETWLRLYVDGFLDVSDERAFNYWFKHHVL